jgi:hypothetical protein
MLKNRILREFIGSLRAAIQQKQIAFSFRYTQCVWHFATCLQRNLLIKYVNIYHNGTGLWLNIGLSYYNNQAAFTHIAVYRRLGMQSQQTLQSQGRFNARTSPLLIGWNAQRATFCSSHEDITDNSLFGRQPVDGFSWLVFILK